MNYKFKTTSVAGMVGCCLGFLLILIAAVLLSTAIIMGFWNWVLVPVFGISEINWLQAFMIGLFINLVGSAFKTISSN